MSEVLPDYYSSLEPFRTIFARGNPILTYHNVGPRPGPVRLKGLYLSRKLFAGQLQELRDAGFRNGSLAECAGPHKPGAIVITFDDGYANVLRHGLEPLAQTGFRAVQFIVAGLLGKKNEWDAATAEAPELMMDAIQIREWLAAGHEIGSHTLSHPWLTRVPLDRAREEIRSSKSQLEDLFSRPIEHFCYPYGDWNEAVRDLVMEGGYKSASTTQAGVNGANSSSFLLKRFTARYASRSLRTLWSRLIGPARRGRGLW